MQISKFKSKIKKFFFLSFRSELSGAKKPLQLLILVLFFLLIPCFTFAQSDNIFKAKVIKITEQRENKLGDGTTAFQQNLKLQGLEGELKNKEFDFNGIEEFDVVKKNFYKVGDKVLVTKSLDAEGNANYYITDYVRSNSLWYLTMVFILVVFAVGKFKGLRALISLVLTFLVVLKYIIPKILAGANPVITTIIGSFIILFIIIYLTDGFGEKSHLAIASILISLFITAVLAEGFIVFAKLSGMFGEEVFYLINIAGQNINFKGLLLAGIIIGCLGVLDDVVIAQITTVEQLLKADKNQSKKEVFRKAYKVGISHISSMINTLFLAYAGASISLLILFASGESAFSSWGQLINNESIATEIVRTIVGSIGLILSVPIATGLAVWKLKK